MFKYKELFDGTNMFSNSSKLGKGSFGSVYLCKLASESLVTVKKLNPVAFSKSEFMDAILTLIQFSHKNLLPLIGYSFDGPNPCLVYNYMEYGSLEANLKRTNWENRYKIALGTAEGIVHLHTFAEAPLIHLNIKSSNILLSNNFVPKLGDFGTVKFGPKNEEKPSPYDAPELSLEDISVKVDVFSFGVVLLELVTGLSPYSDGNKDCNVVALSQVVVNWETLIDGEPGEENADIIVFPMFSIARKCIQSEKRKRPTMVQTLRMLSKI